MHWFLPSWKDLPVILFSWEMSQKYFLFNVTLPVNWGKSLPCSIGSGNETWSHCNLK